MCGAGAGHVVAFSGRALGSPLRLEIRLPGSCVGDHPAATAAWSAVRTEFEAVDRALSRFRADSELTALNRVAGSGSVVPVSWRLRHALAVMDRARRTTAGRFDPMVARALEALGEAGAPVAPSPGPGPGTGEPPGSASADLLERPRLVHAPAAPVDTGGIGKGLALRWGLARAATVLPAGASVLLEAGGDLAADGQGSKGGPGTDGWRVGIEDPAGDGGGDPLAVVELDRGAIATSSVRLRHWTSPAGHPVHHLVDPRTWQPARTGLLAVTVRGDDPAWAEVWTKVLFLFGREAIGFEARRRGLAAWWVADDGRLGMTPAARAISIWVAESRVG